MIETSEGIDHQLIDQLRGHRPAVLSESARTSALLRFVASLLLGSAVLLSAGWVFQGELPALINGIKQAVVHIRQQPATEPPVILPASTPTLNGPLTLLPLAPDELMQDYPPATGQALSDGSSGLPAWQRYRRPAATTTQPRLAILLTGLGLNQALTTSAILYLPPDISLSFSPYAPDLDRWIQAARAHGHEALVDLPSESAAVQDDSGADGLMTGLRPEENAARLARILARAPQVIGVASALGSRFLTDPAVVQPILTDLADHGLAAIESSPDPRLQLASLSAAGKQPHAKAAAMIDGAESREDILRILAGISGLPRSSQALTVASPSPLALALILGWCKQLSNQGIALTPISNMLAQ